MGARRVSNDAGLTKPGLVYFASFNCVITVNLFFRNQYRLPPGLISAEWAQIQMDLPLPPMLAQMARLKGFSTSIYFL
jgi:hypothetical protein